jgi:hypothetical protein
MLPESYTIIVRDGKRHVLKEVHKDYEVAMARLEKIESIYADRYWIDFRTNF